MRTDANVSILFSSLPLLEQPAAAAEAGFEAIELWWPFDVPVPSSSDVDDLMAAIEASGLRLVLLNLATGDRASQQHGLLAVADAAAVFRANVEVVADMVGRLQAPFVNSHFGNLPEGGTLDDAWKTAVASLAWAAPRIAAAGATLLVEALNPVDFPAYGLHHVAEAAELVGRASDIAGVPVRLLFDAYHVQLTEGDLFAPLAACAGDIGHVQVADVPGRGRPGSGGLPIDRFLAELKRSGYDGWVGLEYLPSADPADTFAWLRGYGEGSRSPDVR